MFQTKLVEKIKTRFIFSGFLPKIVPFMEKCGIARQATDNSMAHAHCMLDN